MFIVFDLDGTLADCEHRREWIDKDACRARGESPDWDGFFRQCEFDKPIRQTIDMLCTFWAEGHRVEIWSGRSDAVRDMTLGWLARNGVPSGVPLKMRGDGDFTPDDELKLAWLRETETRAKGRPDVVFDDRNKVVAMWRREGVFCAQVAEGDF